MSTDKIQKPQPVPEFKALEHIGGGAMIVMNRAARELVARFIRHMVRSYGRDPVADRFLTALACGIERPVVFTCGSNAADTVVHPRPTAAMQPA